MTVFATNTGFNSFSVPTSIETYFGLLKGFNSVSINKDNSTYFGLLKGFNSFSVGSEISLGRVEYPVGVALSIDGTAKITNNVTGEFYFSEMVNGQFPIYLFYDDSYNKESITISIEGDLSGELVVANPESNNVYTILLSIEACIDWNETNPYNFIRLHRAVSELPILKDTAYCRELEINPLMYARECLYESSVYVTEEEEYSFFHNDITGADNSDTSSLLLRLVKDSDYSVVHTFPLGTIQSIGSRISFSFIMPDIQKGRYRFVIDNGSFAYYISNLVTYINTEKARLRTSLIETYDFKNRLGYNYESGAKSCIRLGITQKHIQPIFENKTRVYKEVSSGKVRSTVTESEKVISFHISYVDMKTIDSIQKMLENSVFKVNQKRYTLKGTVSPPQNQSRGIISAEFEAYESEYSELDYNNSCT